MERFVVIDLETTGHSPANKDKIIEIGLVIIEDNKIVDQRNTLFNPARPIPPFITNLTKIKNEDVENAPYFHEKADKIIELFEDSYLVAHNVPFDLGFLNGELQKNGRPALKNPVIDTVELSRILCPTAPGYKLNQLAEHFDIKHTNPHRALSDAYVTAELFLKLKDKLESLPYETLYHLSNLEKMLKSDLGIIFQEQLEKASFENHDSGITSFNGIAFRMEDEDVLEDVKTNTSFGEYLDDIYEAGGTLQAYLSNYEKRTGQREMSETIYDAFQAKKHALIEAETGTGKSLAYLLPALYEAVSTKKRLVVSTYTTQLQTQLLNEEIPLIKKIVPFPFHAVLLKGKSHYISLERFAYELNNNEQDNYDITLTKAILLIWLTETLTGDIDEIQLPSFGYSFFNRISAEAEGKIDVFSPWHQYSFYTRIKRKAQKSDLIITNHALLCTDMFNNYRYIPAYSKLIIDEAHHLESTAAHHYGMRTNNITLHFILNQIGRSAENKLFGRIIGKYSDSLDGLSFEKWDDIFDKTKSEIDELFEYLIDYVVQKKSKTQILSDVGRIQYRFDDEIKNTKTWNTIKEIVSRLTFYYRDLIHYLSLIDVYLEEESHYNKNDKQELLNIMEKLQSIIDELEVLFLSEEVLNHVQWIEIDSKGVNYTVHLYSEPADVSSLLLDDLFMKKDSVVLTSATLTMRNSFQFIIKRLGLPEERLLTKQIASPFSYEKQVQLLVPNDFPNMKYGDMDDFIYATSEAILSLAEITDGRMLVLFTSYDMLKKSYKLLKEIMGDKYMLIGQGITSGSRSRLKKSFQSFERSILLGTSSFWEGVDIPGEDLSCLMIVRLPFQPPNHPVFEARAEELKNSGGNPFMDLSLPNAVIRFKQGFGRLIRSANDRGIVFICDARVTQKQYGKYFTDSIPKVPLKYDSTQKLIHIAKNWF